MTTPKTAIRRRRVWLAIIPFVVVGIVFTITGVAWWTDRFTPRDDGFLRPDSAAPAGAAELARRLRNAGVTIEVYHDSWSALVAADTGDATLFIPTPGYVFPGYLGLATQLPASTRTVVVQPDALTATRTDLGVIASGGNRWATGTTWPTCDLPEARRAGRAAVIRSRYAPRHGGNTCYQGGLINHQAEGRTQTAVIGAPDPFTNDRIDEQGNAKLATGLLGKYRRVVWLDLTKAEKAPANPAQKLPHQADQDGQGRGDGGSEGGASDNDDRDEISPLDAFPSWLRIGLLQLLIAGVLLALWAGRRLGQPVSEPLPVVVRSAETAHGRAALYQRAHARGAAFENLRAGALAKLVPPLGLGQQPARDHVITLLAARTGWPAQRIQHLLYGPVPTTDQDLINATAALDAMVDVLAQGDRR